LGAVIGLLCGAAVCAMLEAVSARRRQAMGGYWQAPSDERYRDEPFTERREPEDGNWQDPPDERFRDRRAPEPDSWVPVHEVADYRFRR
jgi:hypothetical protein